MRPGFVLDICVRLATQLIPVLAEQVSYKGVYGVARNAIIFKKEPVDFFPFILFIPISTLILPL